MAWSKSGAWASQVEDAANGDGDDAFPALGEAFPSLSDAATTKGGNADGIPAAKGKKDKKKKAKPVAISLQEFAAQHNAGDELADLPTAPRKVEGGEQEQGGLGGGFKGYGGDRRRYGDDERPPRRMEEVGPSRADESDDWGRDRKFVSGPTPSRGGFGGGFDRQDRPPRGEYIPSRADEAGSWGRSSPLPSAPERRGGFGGFDDRPPRRQYDLGSGARADDTDTWTRKDPLPPSTGRSTPDSAERWSGGDRADRVDRWGGGRDARPASREDSTPRERPRLVLKPRTVPVDNAAEVPETNGAADKDAKPSSNPFGAARPREEVLKAKGVPVDDPEQLREKLSEVLESLQQQAEADGEAKVTVVELGSAELDVKDAVALVQRKLDALTVGDGKKSTPSPDGKEQVVKKEPRGW